MDVGHQEKPFADRILEAIEYPPRQGEPRREVRDDEESGLLLKVTSTGAASWYVYLYDSIAKKTRPKKIGDFSTLRLEDARRKAREKREGVALLTASGKSFVEIDEADRKEREIKREIAEWTLQKCYDEYIAANHTLKPRSVDDYRKALTNKKNAPEILDQPVALIARHWFVERFKQIYDRSISSSWKWWSAMHAVLWYHFEIRPHLFRDGFPVPKKNGLGPMIKKVGRKSKRISPQDLPVLRNKLLEMDRYDRDLVLMLLLLGCRSGAAKRLRWDMTVLHPQFKSGVIRIIDTEDDDWKKGDVKEVVVSDEVQRLLLSRYKDFGKHSEWVFWQRGNVMRCRTTDYRSHCGIDGGERETFARLDMASNEGARITPHDLRRTFNHMARSVLKIDPLIVAILQTQSTANMSVPDGYLGAKPEDMRRETNRISAKFLAFLRSTPDEIMQELGIVEQPVEELGEFVL